MVESNAFGTSLITKIETLCSRHKVHAMANADIDRYLGALAATKAEEKQFYLYKSKNEEGESVLVERIYANENLSRELSIGPGSKSDSLACLADDKGVSSGSINSLNSC